MVKSQQLFDRLKQKKAYSKFMKDNPDAFLYAIFCIVSNNETEGDKIQFDFYNPKTNKIAYSEYPFDEIKIPVDDVKGMLNKLNLENIKIDTENLWEVAKKIQVENKDSSIVTKIIGVLRENFWDLTCTTSSLDIIKIKFNSLDGNCIEYKKESLMNLIQVKRGKNDFDKNS